VGVSDDEDEAGAYLGWLSHRSKNLIRLPLVWAAIEALANALLQLKTIHSRKARKIMRAGSTAGFKNLEKLSPSWAVDDWLKYIEQHAQRREV